jgi:hypothetical protein
MLKNMVHFETSDQRETVNQLNDRAAANLVLPRMIAAQKKARRARVHESRRQGAAKD